jgi:hypothetical protein
MRIPAVLYLPEHPGSSMPGMLIVPGHGGDKYCWYSFYTGILYARAGAAVLTYEPIGEGERNSERRSGTRAHDRVIDVPGYPQRLAGLMIADVMQGVSYLRERGDVDPDRIAVLRYSLGSFVTVLAGAVDWRIPLTDPERSSGVRTESRARSTGALLSSLQPVSGTRTKENAKCPDEDERGCRGEPLCQRLAHSQFLPNRQCAFPEGSSGKLLPPKLIARKLS